MKLYGSSEMAHIDRMAIDELGIPSSILMENAGRATVNYIRHRLGSAGNCYAPIFVGPGNNGGDGLVVGRHLLQHGCTPLFFILAAKEQLSQDSLLFFSIIEKLRLPYVFVTHDIKETYRDLCAPYKDQKCYAIIDAIFGVGLCRDVTGLYADAINLMNSERAHTEKPLNTIPSLVSCDIVSGIDANTGLGLGTWVQADFTATYSYAKAGLMQADGKQASGEVKILDIGIPASLSTTIPPLFETIDDELCAAALRNSPRKNDSHKGTHGHILIIGGSKGMAGAALLTGKASLKMGSGLTTLAVPGILSSVFESQLYEAMTIALGSQEDQFLKTKCLPKIKPAIDSRDIIAIGPGLGTEDETVATVRQIYQYSTKPVVVDADAINALVDDREILTTPRGPRIFTPHPGEMARLLHTSISNVQKNRREAVRTFLTLFNDCPHEVVLVLKGEASLVATTKSDTLYLNTSGNSGMATGGMGDVLTGIIASLLGQGLSYIDAAVTGTYIHGMAADHLAHCSGIGFTASEVASVLPLCRKKLESITT